MLVELHFRSGRPIWVNPETVQWITVSDRQETEIHILGGAILVVMESIHHVLDRLGAHTDFQWPERREPWEGEGWGEAPDEWNGGLN